MTAPTPEEIVMLDVRIARRQMIEQQVRAFLGRVDLARRHLREKENSGQIEGNQIMTFTVEELAKNIFPDAANEGWGEAVIKTTLRPAYSLGSVGNCGIALLQSVGVGEGPANFSEVFPTAIKSKYMSPWAEMTTSWCNHYTPYLKKLVEKHEEALFRLIVKEITTKTMYNCLLLTDGINKHSKVRGASNDYYWPSTGWFGRMLVKYKEGYVVQSPIAINAAHNSPTDFGLVQAWIWFPVNSLVFKQEGNLGHGKMISTGDLVEQIHARWGNFTTKSVSKEDIENNYLKSYKAPKDNNT